MTANRKAKAAARTLAAESGRSYTHERRADSGPGAAEPADHQTIPADELPMYCTECGRSLGPSDGSTCELCGMDLEVAAEPAGYPRFPADAALVVDAHNGDEQWTGREWNDYAAKCEDPVTGGLFTVRLVRIVDRGTADVDSELHDHQFTVPRDPGTGERLRPGFADCSCGMTHREFVASSQTQRVAVDDGRDEVDYAKSPMLHQNGRGLEHEAAFRAATEEDQARHLKRQHMLSDVDGARRTATDPGKPLASLSETHEWWHIRQRRHG